MFETTRPARAACLLIGLTALVQLAVAGRVGLGTDEAHYALYGAKLDWSYFDHPPLVGWTSALFQHLFGTGELALRVPAILLCALCGVLVYRLTRALFPDAPKATPFVAVCLHHGALFVHALGFALLPENLLLVTGLLTMLALVRVLNGGGMTSWLLLGLALGAAGLAKYTALLLLAPVVVGLVGEGRLLSSLRSPGPWLAALVGAAMVSPVFVWNARNEWISFAYQADHGGGGGDPWEFGQFATGVATPLLAYSPVLFVLGWGAMLKLRHAWGSRGTRLSVALALPVVVVFGVASGWEVSLPHWTAMAWVGLTPLVALRLTSSDTPRWPRRLAVGSLILNGTLLVLLFSHALLVWMPLPDHKRPLAALTGWDQASVRAHELLAGLETDGAEPPRLFIDSWSRASRIAWYGRPTPVIVLDRRFDQFDLWFGSPEPGDRGLLVAWDGKGRTKPPSDLGKFEHTELIEELPIRLGGALAATFRFYACEGYRGRR